MNSPSQKQN